MLNYTRTDWLARAEALDIRRQAFIDSNFVDALSGKTFDSINPATGVGLAQVAECDAAEDLSRACRVSDRLNGGTVSLNTVDLCPRKRRLAA